MSNIFKRFIDLDGTVDYIFNQEEFNKVIYNLFSNPLIKYIEEFCKSQNTKDILIIGTRDNIDKYKENTKKYFEDKINLKFIYVNEYIIGIDNKDKIFIANNNPIELNHIEFKYEPQENLYLTSRYYSDIIDINKKVIKVVMEENENEENKND